MFTGKKIWQSLVERFVSPQVDDAELERLYRQLQRNMPTPVFWLLGKTQSGKTSLIRALTDNTRAEIGNGLRPCTRTAQVYDFPSSEDCILRFLDTRGLGEVDYDPSEDLQQFMADAHLIVVVIKALDHAQQGVMDALKKILKSQPDWPVLVVQTCLHEGYPNREFSHLKPYPYLETPFPPHVPVDLARSLMVQRQMFANARIDARFVPVDFTLPEDGYEPAFYGLVPLWDAIEDLLPLGLRGVLQRIEQVRENVRDLQYKAAHAHVVSYALAAGAAAGFPVPMVDMPLVVGIQAKMFHAVASIYQQDLSKKRMAEILSSIGVSYLARLGGRELLKVIPGLGSAVSAIYAAASTYALGLTLCAYFSRSKNGVLPNKEEFQKIYDEHFQQGREKLQAYVSQLRSQEQAKP